MKDKLWYYWHRTGWLVLNNARVWMVQHRLPARIINILSGMCVSLYVQGMFE